MASIKVVGSIIGLIILLLFYSAAYTVNEGEQALLARLGNIVTKAGQPYVLGPGLHWKMPLITQAVIFDTRLQTMDIKSSRIVTAEQKDVIVDYYVKWRINNLMLFYTRTGGDVSRAEQLLEQQLNDNLRAQFGRRNISEVVSAERTTIMDSLSQQANNSARNLGIQVVDVRIKRIDLPTEVSAAVFDRMRAERQRVAMEHRATGKANAEAIRANADANATIILATAREQAASIRGSGDAEAAKIYVDAYSKDVAFYSFYRSLLAYKKAFSNRENNILVLKPESEFFRYFNNQPADKK